MTPQQRLGNLLGAAQAEADGLMLHQAFIETADYHALLHTTDFSYVVGRRGTGKSALYQRLKERFAEDTGLILIAEEPQDFEMLELQSLLIQVSDSYRSLRAISRLLWSVNLLIKSCSAVVKHYKYNKSVYSFLFHDYVPAHKGFLDLSGASNCIRILRAVKNQSETPEDIPRIIAEEYEIARVERALREALEVTGFRIVTLFDRLDEAWLPEVVPVAVLGGIAKMAADYREKELPFYPLVFVRDNMFRALAQYDDDFTRHIEGHSLRLQWDEQSLFHLVAARLRVALNIPLVESEIKVWNRFAYRELHNREGFARCLRYTLFRPRDILVLLNEAYVNARRVGRETIVENDIETSATSISQNRLEDLCKEYDRVLPGLRLFVSSFRGRSAQDTFGAVADHLQAVAEFNDYSELASRDLGLFENGGEMFSALYSVGFLGLKDAVSGNYKFCHDGTRAALVSIEANRETLVHPCYWKALDIGVAPDSEEILIQVSDEYSVPPTGDVADLRIRRLGQLPEQLSNIPLGTAGSRAFEAWVLRAVRVLFSGSLTNIDLHPNPHTALSQRDVVATNATTTNLWRRVYQDYQSRQVIFECKNYTELTPEDFRQMLDYSTGEYGRFLIVVRRGATDILTENEKDRTRALFFEHERLVVILPAYLLGLCVRKLRTPKKYDYTEFTISKHLDTIVRSVLSLTHMPRYRQKRRK